MIAASTIQEVREQVAQWKRAGLTVGLVPTMGYLHEGHASLVDKAREMCGKVIASDFVNPTQFGPNEDLEAYPRDFDRDCALLEAHGCDLVFHPSVEEMYAPNAATYVEILDEMPKQLCGKTRPIHFRGVCTVVSKLFNIVQPDYAFFGQKDAQQLAIIRRMVRDARTRGTSAANTIAMWPSVRRGEDQYIFPFQEEADVMFNSALIYELAVLKPYAESILFGIPKDIPEYIEAKRLLKFLDYFIGINTEDIPKNSLMREFVGGSIFKV